MAASNDITGDQIKSRILSKEGRDNWDNIFGKKEDDSKEKTDIKNPQKDLKTKHD